LVSDPKRNKEKHLIRVLFLLFFFRVLSSGDYIIPLLARNLAPIFSVLIL